MGIGIRVAISPAPNSSPFSNVVTIAQTKTILFFQEPRLPGLQVAAAGGLPPGDYDAALPADHGAVQRAAETLHALHGPHDARGAGREAGHLGVPVPVQGQKVELFHRRRLHRLRPDPEHT